MSPTAAAWLVYCLISAPFSWSVWKTVRDLFNSDPLHLCDTCREFRRRLNVSAQLPDALVAVVFALIGFIWPALAFAYTRRVVQRRPKHSCERTRAEQLAGEA